MTPLPQSPWILPTPENLAALRDRWTGQRGGSEPETHIGRTPGDDVVRVHSNIGADICGLIDKRPEVIRRFRESRAGETLYCVLFDCDPAMWSGIAGCFKSAGRAEAARERAAAGKGPSFGRPYISAPTLSGENGETRHSDTGTGTIYCHAEVTEGSGGAE